MTDNQKGSIFVAAQFILIALLVLIPVDQSSELANLLAGVFLLAPGLIILLVSIRTLGRSLQANPVPAKRSELVTTGIYSSIRHPIYTGLLLATLATVVQSLSGLKFAIWLALLVLLVLKSRFEEQLLERRYEAYAEYKKQTGRFLPRIGK